MPHSDKIELFKEETIKFNRKHNLISRKNTEKIIDEAIKEATALTKHLNNIKYFRYRNRERAPRHTSCNF